MIGLDICSLENDPYHFCIFYNVELLLGLASLIASLLTLLYAFAGDRFNPHTAIMRAFVFADVVSSFAYVLEALTAILPKDPEVKQDLSPPEALFVPVSSCIMFRPYLFLFSMSRQWVSILALIMGLERFLFICYPLWFKVVRVRRLPIIMFTTCFVCLSASIGYTNSLVVAPEEAIHFTCDATWAFGDHYGWCQSFIMITCVIAAWFFTFYAYRVAREEKALGRFGNNRTRMQSERRKIRKAIWMLSCILVCYAIPQLAIVGVRLYARFRLHQWKLVLNQLFMVKVFANALMTKKLGRGSSIYLFLLFQKFPSPQTTTPFKHLFKFLSQPLISHPTSFFYHLDPGKIHASYKLLSRARRTTKPIQK